MALQSTYNPLPHTITLKTTWIILYTILQFTLKRHKIELFAYYYIFNCVLYTRTVPIELMYFVHQLIHVSIVTNFTIKIFIGKGHVSCFLCIPEMLSNFLLVRKMTKLIAINNFR